MKKAMMLSAILLLVGCTDSNEPTSKEKTEETSKEVSKADTQGTTEGTDEETTDDTQGQDDDTSGINPTVIDGVDPSTLKEKYSTVVDWEDSPLADDPNATRPPPGTKVTITQGAENIEKKKTAHELSLSETPVYEIKDRYPEELKTVFKFINAVNRKDREIYQSLTKENFGNTKKWEAFFFDENPDVYIDASEIKEESGWEEYPNVAEYSVKLSDGGPPVGIATKYFEDKGWQIGAIN